MEKAYAVKRTVKITPPKPLVTPHALNPNHPECYGCNWNKSSQREHMEPGGCLWQPLDADFE